MSHSLFHSGVETTVVTTIIVSLRKSDNPKAGPDTVAGVGTIAESIVTYYGDFSIDCRQELYRCCAALSCAKVPDSKD